MTPTGDSEYQAFIAFILDVYRGRYPKKKEVPEVLEIGTGGSNRRFFRVGGALATLVGMWAPNPPANARGVTENQTFLYVARHLVAYGVAVPKVYAADEANGWFALEDVGDRLLYDIVQQAGESPDVQDLYHRAVDDLAWIHCRAGQGFDPTRIHNPPYDATFVRQYESGYFQEWFLERVAGVTRGDSALDQDLDQMAGCIDRLTGASFLYRDFQSQNIAVQEVNPEAARGRTANVQTTPSQAVDQVSEPGDKPVSKAELRYLDFQGARIGPRQYDLASLLYDPYVELSPHCQSRLFQRYLERSAQLEPSFDPVAFGAGFPVVCAHRLMQALGAYGFLSLGKGKTHFAAHIPAAVRLLQSLIRQYQNLIEFNTFARCVKDLNPQALSNQSS